MKHRKRILFLIIVSALIFMLAGCEKKEEQETEALEGQAVLSFITVGKGDAFLLTAPDGQHFLFDTGKAEDFIQIAKVLREKEVDRLDGIFLSHGHKDHTGSLPYLLQSVETGNVYYSMTDQVSYDKCDILSIIEGTGAVPVPIEGRQTLDLGGVKAEVWIPEVCDEENENNNSVVVMLRFGKNACLMTGDMEKKEEELFLRENPDVQADILKLGHHGKEDATSEVFLKRVSPEYGLIAGNEQEDPETVNDLMKKRLDAAGVKVYYSEGDRLAWDFTTDGEHIFVSEVKDTLFEEAEEGIELTEREKEEQHITMVNNGTNDVDLSGYFLVSKKGDEVYQIPDGTILSSGEQLTIASVDSEFKPEGCLVWRKSEVWKKKDPAFLYNRNLQIVDQLER